MFPAAIFPGGADFGRVVLHAVILLIEAGVLVWLALQLAQLFETTAQKTAEAEAARSPPKRAPTASASRPNGAPSRSATPRRRELAAGFERKIGGIVEAVAVAATRNAGHVVLDEQQQRGGRAPDRGRRHRVDAGLGQRRERWRRRPKN